jgi:rhodanese-related sulfurtransferase
MMGWLKSLFAPASEQISAQEAVHRLNRGAVLIDVREPGEFAAGHAPQARHLPLGRIRSEGAAAVDALGIAAATGEVLLVCQSGMRSRMAQATLAKDTRRRYINISGGMNAWASLGLPVKRGR